MSKPSKYGFPFSDSENLAKLITDPKIWGKTQAHLLGVIYQNLRQRIDRWPPIEELIRLEEKQTPTLNKYHIGKHLKELKKYKPSLAGYFSFILISSVGSDALDKITEEIKKKNYTSLNNYITNSNSLKFKFSLILTIIGASHYPHDDDSDVDSKLDRLMYIDLLSPSEKELLQEEEKKPSQEEPNKNLKKIDAHLKANENISNQTAKQHKEIDTSNSQRKDASDYPVAKPINTKEELHTYGFVKQQVETLSRELRVIEETHKRSRNQLDTAENELKKYVRFSAETLIPALKETELISVIKETQDHQSSSVKIISRTTPQITQDLETSSKVLHFQVPKQNNTKSIKQLSDYLTDIKKQIRNHNIVCEELIEKLSLIKSNYENSEQNTNLVIEITKLFKNQKDFAYVYLDSAIRQTFPKHSKLRMSMETTGALIQLLETEQPNLKLLYQLEKTISRLTVGNLLRLINSWTYEFINYISEQKELNQFLGGISETLFKSAIEANLDDLYYILLRAEGDLAPLLKKLKEKNITLNEIIAFKNTKLIKAQNLNIKSAALKYLKALQESKKRIATLYSKLNECIIDYLKNEIQQSDENRLKVILNNSHESLFKNAINKSMAITNIEKTTIRKNNRYKKYVVTQVIQPFMSFLDQSLSNNSISSKEGFRVLSDIISKDNKLSRIVNENLPMPGDVKFAHFGIHLNKLRELNQSFYNTAITLNESPDHTDIFLDSLLDLSPRQAIELYISKNQFDIADNIAETIEAKDDKILALEGIANAKSKFLKPFKEDLHYIEAKKCVEKGSDLEFWIYEYESEIEDFQNFNRQKILSISEELRLQLHEIKKNEDPQFKYASIFLNEHYKGQIPKTITPESYVSKSHELKNTIYAEKRNHVERLRIIHEFLNEDELITEHDNLRFLEQIRTIDRPDAYFSISQSNDIAEWIEVLQQKLDSMRDYSILDTIISLLVFMTKEKSQIIKGLELLKSFRNSVFNNDSAFKSSKQNILKFIGVKNKPDTFKDSSDNWDKITDENSEQESFRDINRNLDNENEESTRSIAIKNIKHALLELHAELPLKAERTGLNPDEENKIRGLLIKNRDHNEILELVAPLISFGIADSKDFTPSKYDSLLLTSYVLANSSKLNQDRLDLIDSTIYCLSVSPILDFATPEVIAKTINLLVDLRIKIEHNIKLNTPSTKIYNENSDLVFGSNSSLFKIDVNFFKICESIDSDSRLPRSIFSGIYSSLNNNTLKTKILSHYVLHRMDDPLYRIASKIKIVGPKVFSLIKDWGAGTSQQQEDDFLKNQHGIIRDGRNQQGFPPFLALIQNLTADLATDDDPAESLNLRHIESNIKTEDETPWIHLNLLLENKSKSIWYEFISIEVDTSQSIIDRIKLAENPTDHLEEKSQPSPGSELVLVDSKYSKETAFAPGTTNFVCKFRLTSKPTQAINFDLKLNYTTTTDVSGKVSKTIRTVDESLLKEKVEIDSHFLDRYYPGRTGKPVKGEFFKGREEELKFIEDSVYQERNSIAIVGPRRIGKTSLRQAFFNTRTYNGDGTLKEHKLGDTFLITINGATSTQSDTAGQRLFTKILAKVRDHESLKRLYNRVENVDSYNAFERMITRFQRDANQLTFSFSDATKQLVRQLRKPQLIENLVIIIDEAQAIEDQQLLYEIKEEILDSAAYPEQSIQFVFVGSGKLRYDIELDRDSALWNSIKSRRLGSFQDNEFKDSASVFLPDSIQDEYLPEDKSLRDSILKRAVEITGRNPLFLSILGSKVVSHIGRSKTIDSVALLDFVAEQLAKEPKIRELSLYLQRDALQIHGDLIYKFSKFLLDKIAYLTSPGEFIEPSRLNRDSDVNTITQLPSYNFEVKKKALNALEAEDLIKTSTSSGDLTVSISNHLQHLVIKGLDFEERDSNFLAAKGAFESSGEYDE